MNPDANAERNVLKPGNLAYLVTAVVVAVLLTWPFHGLEYPLRLLWAKTFFVTAKAFGADASILSVAIKIPSISPKYEFSFAGPYVGMTLYVKTMLGLVLIGFFLIRSHLAKWSMFVLSVPVSTVVAVTAVGVAVLCGRFLSLNLGLFIYFEALGVVSNIVLLLILGSLALFLRDRTKIVPSPL